MMEECLTFISRYLREGVNTRLDRRCARNFFLNQHDDELSLFPKVGNPIGEKRKRKGKGFTLDFQSLKQAHRYVVFNCDNAIVETYIKMTKNGSKKPEIASKSILAPYEKARTREQPTRKNKKQPLCPSMAMDDFLVAQNQMDPAEVRQIEQDVQQLEQD
uniref:Uncharacterized protein n=1 Tax=Chenopodium quinoa TaxID=63459 RepID=A0A803MK83_CHEQI